MVDIIPQICNFASSKPLYFIALIHPKSQNKIYQPHIGSHEP